ncbi:hypothetical protein [Arachidicoccus terrestris]|uniref:hypothetical protein n=1 Tax=Arachidicoccus terrestris TaxID=2875539 RepID=UPI001CC424FB|nr:hypothetical protein [Arachidicoccus terrestris]UAY55936.1 hypothetical protein K9M52_02565 [Arachidicoccus terrestris]
MSHSNKSIDISQLNISVENPRFERVSNQREAIRIMIEKQGDKLLKLGNDILQYGLNPAESILVLKNKKVSGSGYEVLEGNRRVTVLKLLENPNLITETHKSLLNGFKKLNTKFQQNPTEKVNCVVFDSEDDANHWIDLKHTGQNDGVGIVPWDAQQKARFDAKTKGKTNYALQVLDYLGKSESVDSSTKAKLKKVNSSSLQRLVGDPVFRKFCGLDIKDGKVTSILHPKEFVKPLTKVVNDLLRDDFTVKDIYYKDDRQNYIETFKKVDMPNYDDELPGSWELIGTEPVGKAVGTPKSTAARRSKVLSTKRNTIIPKWTSIPINQSRVNKIYRELKDLDLRDFENAAAISFRVFIELTLDSYIEKNPIEKVTSDSKLSNKLQAVATDILNKGHLNKQKLKGAFTAASTPDSIFSINTFNAYVHNKDFHPDPTSLKKNWDNLESFISKIWELI